MTRLICRGMATLLFAGWGTAAFADPLLVSKAVLVGGQAADTITTVIALRDGRLHEANPLLLRFTAQPALFVALKVGTTAGLLYATSKLPRPWAIAANLGAGLFAGGVAGHNLYVSYTLGGR